jgi:hypothetical protein
MGMACSVSRKDPMGYIQATNSKCNLVNAHGDISPNHVRGEANALQMKAGYISVQGIER